MLSSLNKDIIVPRLFEQKRKEHSIRLSVLPWFRGFPPLTVGSFCAELLLQFYADLFETLQVFLSWSEEVHVVCIESSD